MRWLQAPLALLGRTLRARRWIAAMKSSELCAASATTINAELSIKERRFDEIDIPVGETLLQA
jgi:hypothetical protein